jgi:hypothetical protein
MRALLTRAGASRCRVAYQKVVRCSASKAATSPDLAKAAGVGLATVKRFETGVAPIPAVKAAMVRALVEAGIEFSRDRKRIGVSISVRKLPK